MPEGDDGRKAVLYPAEKAQFEGLTQRSVVRERVSIGFVSDASGSITWNISTGVANIYAFRFTYMNRATKPIEVRLQLIAEDGTVVKDDRITFPVAPDKWRTLNSSTGGFINAGKYRLVLSADNMNGLMINALTLQ